MTTSTSLTDALGSAKATRNRYRQAEGSAARLRLLTDAGMVLASERDNASTLKAMLAKALGFMSMEEGLLLYLQDDGLLVHAAQGTVPPVGACLPVNGALHKVLQDDAPPMIQHDIHSRLKIGRDKAVHLEILVPMRCQGKTVGILVLMSARQVSAPVADDLGVLQVLGTMFAVAYLVSAKPALSIAANESTAKLKQLTSRELQVFSLMPRGLTNAALARELGIAAGTVKVHIERILHKLDLRDRTQAAVYAVDHGYGG